MHRYAGEPPVVHPPIFPPQPSHSTTPPSSEHVCGRRPFSVRASAEDPPTARVGQVLAQDRVAQESGGSARDAS